MHGTYLEIHINNYKWKRDSSLKSEANYRFKIDLKFGFENGEQDGE